MFPQSKLHYFDKRMKRLHHNTILYKHILVYCKKLTPLAFAAPIKLKECLVKYLLKAVHLKTNYFRH